MKITAIIPVYNEVATIEEIVRRVKDVGLISEILIVDDGSTDGTRDLLVAYDNDPVVKIILKDTNEGKGSAVLAGMQAASGEILLIQDADLEYDPRDYPALLKPLEEGVADVVYGSRFLGGPHRTILFWNMLANKLLTLMTNVLYNNILTDMETGYKAFRREVLDGLDIKSKRFNFEPEFTAKILKSKFRIYEVPISFNPREYHEGKKIGLRDAFEAVWALIKYRFVN